MMHKGGHIKKLFTCMVVIFYAAVCLCQVKAPDYIKKPTLLINFLLNDFRTADLIRRSSVGDVINNKDWSRIKEMDAGLGLQYIQGYNAHIDISGRLDISSLDYLFRNKPLSGNTGTLLETDANIHVKLLTDQYWIVPYINAGLGFSLYKGYTGIYMPVGSGFQFNLGKGESFIFTGFQYRIPLTTNTNFHFNYSLGFGASLSTITK